MYKPTVLTIILNYQTPDMTLKSLTAARQEMQGIEGEIVVVDNCSGDGSFENLAAYVAHKGWHANNRVRVVQSGHNGGFGAGNNFAIRKGLSNGKSPDYIYVLNSDAFPKKGAISSLLQKLTLDRSLGMAGSRIIGPDKSPHPTAFRFPSIAGEIEAAMRFGPVSRLLGKHIVAMPIPATSCQVDWLAGASLMIRRHMLDQIGLFDEEFFLYFEETDLCLRANRAGWKNYYVKESLVTHIGGASTGMKKWARVPEYWLDSRQHYFTKNHSAIYASIATLAHLFGGAAWQVRRLLQNKPAIDPPHFLRDLLRHDLTRRFRPAKGMASQSRLSSSTQITQPKPHRRKA